MNNTIVQLTENIFAVEVPKELDSWGLGIAAMFKGLPYLAYDMKGMDYQIPLPKGEYKALFLSSQVTEEQAASVVGKTKHYTWGGFGYAKTEDVFLDYTNLNLSICRKATESFKTLLQSNNLSGNYAILGTIIKK